MNRLAASLVTVLVTILSFVVVPPSEATTPGFTPAPGSPFVAASGTNAVAVGDFNGDRVLDIAATRENGLVVLLGNGQGGFAVAPGSPVTSVRDADSVVVADANNDGKLDLVVTTAASVSVLLGDGQGTFVPGPGSPYDIGTYFASSLAVGDFNGDQASDVVVVAGSNAFVVLLGDGQGGLTVAPGSPVYTESGFVSAVAVGDFNRDGDLDLAASNYGAGSRGGAVSVFLGDGQGRLSPATGSPFSDGNTYPLANALAVGDFNGDGALDIAVADAATRDVFVLLGDGSGRFSLRPGPSGYERAGFGAPVALAVDDFDGDHRLDLAVVNVTGWEVSVLLGTGTGAFRSAPGSPYATARDPGSVAGGDFNRDGRPDIAVASARGGGLTVLLNGLPPQRSAFKNSAKFCKAEQEFWGNQFSEHYRNFGACVSASR